jgi:CO/xanthine dehydrogenase Mo-binding subunit
VPFSTGRHEIRTDDPDDTLVFDRTVRFVGQRVAAVVAESVAIAREGCRRIAVTYEHLPAIFDPAVSDKVVAEIHGEVGDVATGLEAAAETVRGVWQTQRVQHVHLETHASIGWLDENGRLTVRTSSQVPFLVRRELCRVFGLAHNAVRVFTARVGGGFGAKQEMLTEDLVTLAVLRTGRPVQYEMSRSDEFTSATCRHPMRVEVTAAADADGVLTTLAIDVLSDAGAYGNHSPGVLYHGVSESMSVYRCANKRVDGKAVYTNNIPSGAFRGYGLGQIIFGIECALDELARKLDISPFAFRRRNVVVPGDRFVSAEVDEGDLAFGSYGLDQCIDLAERALRRGNGVAAPESWRTGEGMAIAMIATIPPRGHWSDASASLRSDGSYEIDVGTAEFGNGTTTVHVQIAAAALQTTIDRIVVRQSDTDVTGHDTGAFGSTGIVVAGTALKAACDALRSRIHEITGDRDMTPAEVLDAAGGSLSAQGEYRGSPRSVAFNVHAVRVAVDERTGVVRILQSVQAADAGTVMNPEQCRAQIEGGVAQAIGTSLYEQMLIDDAGAVTTKTLRHYHIPQFADVPPTEVYFADTYDSFGPFGAKSMSESPYNPVAPAIANAVRDAIGVAPKELPMTPDRIWRLINSRP